LFIIAGGIILLVDTGVLPAALHAAVLEESQGNRETLHVAQELGSMLVFGGLITLWFIPRYEQSQFFHWSLTGFWGLLAAVHWFDVPDAASDVAGNLMIAAPMILFASVGVARWMSLYVSGRGTGQELTIRRDSCYLTPDSSLDS
jgi:hypothetical protein